MITIDGMQGEGGGQVLRSSLSLSMATGRPFRITGIRGRRARPGLLRQHLTSVTAAARISGARVEGAEIGSSELVFEPGPVRAGDYSFAVGTAGSTVLVLQTVLPPLLCAEGPSTVRVSGGTHNPSAPPVEFLRESLAPQVALMGGELAVELVRPGFFPAGAGEVACTIVPAREPRPLTLLERGAEGEHRAEIACAHIPAGIADREWRAVERVLAWPSSRRLDRDVSDSAGPGNVLSLFLVFEHVTEVVTSFGAKGVPAEKVGRAAAREAQRYLAGTAPVGEHLADQLLVPLALLAGGSFRTVEPSEHTRTNARVVETFVGPVVGFTEEPGGTCLVDVRGAGNPRVTPAQSEADDS